MAREPPRVVLPLLFAVVRRRCLCSPPFPSLPLFPCSLPLFSFLSFFSPLFLFFSAFLLLAADNAAWQLLPSGPARLALEN